MEGVENGIVTNSISHLYVGGHKLQSRQIKMGEENNIFLSATFQREKKKSFKKSNNIAFVMPKRKMFPRTYFLFILKANISQKARLPFTKLSPYLQ